MTQPSRTPIQEANENPNQDLIFISIASYRDQQLIPTIKDCLAKAKYPDRLRFGICWQHDPEEPTLPYADDPRFRIVAFSYRESKGACWARAECMKLYAGEPWYFQIDSHCRFAPGFDEKLLDAAALTGSAKPIISTYASAFMPADAYYREVLQGVPQLMAISIFNVEGIPHLKPVDIPDWRNRKAPMRARFLAAGFLFTLGKFVEEIGYDPELYFFGEETALTLRAFTHGYDLFHPHEVLVWHDYVRSYATRHWEDQATAKEQSTTPEDESWKEHDRLSRSKVVRLMLGENVDSSRGSFGLGAERTLAEYEAYAGISFRLRKVQDYTRRSLEAPNPPASPDWPARIYSWMVRILLDTKQLSPVAFKDPAFWYVSLQDADRNEIHRHDFPASELAAFTGTEDKIALICELESGIVPVYWNVWPVSKRRGWLSKTSGQLQDGDYAIIDDDGPDDEVAQKIG